MVLSAELSHILSIYTAWNIVNATGFFYAIFVSVGFVAIFAMKGSKLGIVYPLMVILSRLWSYYYIRLSFDLGIYSAEFYSQSIITLGYGIAIIGGLALLAIRNKSTNRGFLIIFAIFYIVRNILSSTIWLAIFGGPVPIHTGFDVLITSLPNLLIGISFAILVIVFFIIESRKGCIEQEQVQEVPFLE